mgnify:CR=1 FL=1
MAIAILASVTVSMAEEISGMLMVMFLETLLHRGRIGGAARERVCRVRVSPTLKQVNHSRERHAVCICGPQTLSSGAL